LGTAAKSGRFQSVPLDTVRGLKPRCSARSEAAFSTLPVFFDGRQRFEARNVRIGHVDAVLVDQRSIEYVHDFEGFEFPDAIHIHGGSVLVAATQQ
jgi:hypothetical protein